MDLDGFRRQLNAHFSRVRGDLGLAADPEFRNSNLPHPDGIAKSFASVTTIIDTDLCEYWFRMESEPAKDRVWTNHHGIRPHKRT